MNNEFYLSIISVQHTESGVVLQFLSRHKLNLHTKIIVGKAKFKIIHVSIEEDFITYSAVYCGITIPTTEMLVNLYNYNNKLIQVENE